MYRISAGSQTENLRESAKFLVDVVYTCISNPENINSIFAAGLYYHVNCFTGYIFKSSMAKKTENISSKPNGSKNN